MIQRKKIALNATQKNIIEGTLKFYLDGIVQVEQRIAIKALKAIFQINNNPEDIILFKRHDIFEDIEWVQNS